MQPGYSLIPAIAESALRVKRNEVAILNCLRPACGRWAYLQPTLQLMLHRVADVGNGAPPVHRKANARLGVSARRFNGKKVLLPPRTDIRRKQQLSRQNIENAGDRFHLSALPSSGDRIRLRSKSLENGNICGTGRRLSGNSLQSCAHWDLGD
jgi:hypothetical protein